jgi:site-specific DNA-cytosine methylase
MSLAGPSIAVSLFAGSERCSDALRFLERNHHPKVLMADMMERMFGDGVVAAKTIHGEAADLPSGLGAYSLGFPCTPWSMRGRRGGFEDSNSQPFQIGLRTIRTLAPLTWTLECVRC